MTLCIHRKRFIVESSSSLIKTGIAYMHTEFGTLPGHTCSDCKDLMRDKMPTICGCRKYPFREGSVMAEYKLGHGWRGHWLACGLWRLAYKKRKAEQLELVVED